MLRTIHYGKEYLVLHENGWIGRNHVKPSENWRVIAAYEYNNFGHEVRRYTLEQIVNDPKSIPWKFKNGKQRTFIRDMDHGTMREWASPGHWVS